MHQDIKTFSDITGINTVNSLVIQLKYKIHGNCLATVCINDRYYVVGEGRIPVGLFDNISLRVNLLDFEEGTSGVEIEYFGINGLEVLPKYQHLATKPTNYIDFYGEWSFEINEPFYVWYQRITGQGWIA